MKIAALVFDKITVLDIVGPVEALSWMPGSEIVWGGKQKGPIRAAPTGLGMIVDKTLDEVTEADILLGAVITRNSDCILARKMGVKSVSGS